MSVFGNLRKRAMNCVMSRQSNANSHGPYNSSASQGSRPTMASSSYVCDTLPPPVLASAINDDEPDSPSPPVTTFDLPSIDVQPDEPSSQDSQPAVELDVQPPARKLCVRHQRMAHEGTNLKLQQVNTTRSGSRPQLTYFAGT